MTGPGIPGGISGTLNSGNGEKMASGLMGGIGTGLSSFMDSFNQSQALQDRRKIANTAEKRQTAQDVMARNKLAFEQEKQVREIQERESLGKIGAGLMQGQTMEEVLKQTGIDPSTLDPVKLSTIQNNMIPDIDIIEVDGNQVARNRKTGQKEILGKAKGFAPKIPDTKLAVGPDGQQFFIKEGDEIPAGAKIINPGEAGGGGPDVKNEGALRKEFNAGAKEFIQIQNAYKTIGTLADQDSATGDLGLIFATMKMFDPASTVREGEFATAEKAAGWPDQAKNLYNKAVSGKKLNPKQRADFVKTAENIFKSRKDQFGGHISRYTDISNQYGFDPARVVRDFTNEGVSNGPSDQDNNGSSDQDNNGASNTPIVEQSPMIETRNQQPKTPEQQADDDFNEIMNRNGLGNSKPSNIGLGGLTDYGI